MSLYRTILVAYDATAAGGVALRQGAELAQACKAQLHVLAVVVTSAGLLFEPAALPGNVLQAERKVLQEAMTAAVGDLGDMGRSVLTCVCDGEAAAEIIAYAEEIAADLVVIGHAEKSPIASWFAGATGKHLLDHLPCSVLIAIDEAPKPDGLQRKNSTAIDPDTHPCACSAVVLELPQGEKPSGIDHFKAATQLCPLEPDQPDPDRPSWLSLGQVISHVHSAMTGHGKQPWIKAGNIVLSPAEIHELHSFYQHHGTRK